jgi:AcrR family transcriptional regulator
MHDTEAAGETRRARRRSDTIAEIKQAALDEIAARSPAGLSIRGVARAIGMSPAGLYRYYAGLDALITDLIVDAYSDLADAVIAGTTGSGSAKARLAAGMVNYREWSISHPSRFLLIFGTPIPGYAAPEGGPTVAAVQRIGAAFFTVGAEAWSRGELGSTSLGRPSTPEEKRFFPRQRSRHSSAPGATSTGWSPWRSWGNSTGCTRTPRCSTAARWTGSCPGSPSSGYEKELPQPQLRVTFGLLMWNPAPWRVSR